MGNFRSIFIVIVASALSGGLFGNYDMPKYEGRHNIHGRGKYRKRPKETYITDMKRKRSRLKNKLAKQSRRKNRRK